MAKEFYDLNIWRKGYDLLIKVYELTLKYPHEEKYGLISDTRRSANSIIANIAESHGRFYFADKIRVLYISRGEVEEVRSHLKIGSGLGYLSEENFKILDTEYQGLSKGINVYISSLHEQSQQLQQK